MADAALRLESLVKRFGAHAATAFVFNSLDSLIKSPAALNPAIKLSATTPLFCRSST